MMIPYFIIAGGIVALDQLVKLLVRSNLSLYESIPFIPGLLNLTYVQNTGAAFSILADNTWLLALISTVVSVVLIVFMCKHPFSQLLGRISMAFVLGGAVGNLIDRVLLGYVVDMFECTFITFPVFNVADSFLVVGGILLCIYILWFYDKETNDDIAKQA